MAVPHWQKSSWEYSLRVTHQEFHDKLRSLPADHLADLAFNDLLNDWCRGVADDGDDKRLPYIGWYWRSVNFAKRDILSATAETSSAS